MNVFKRISSFTGAKLAKNSKRFLFVYHFFAINYENVCDSRLFLTFFQQTQPPSYFLLPFSLFIHKKNRKQISTSPIYNKVQREKKRVKTVIYHKRGSKNATIMRFHNSFFRRTFASSIRRKTNLSSERQEKKRVSE